MDCLFEAIFEIFGEFIIQLVAELFFDSASRGVRQPRSRRSEMHPIGAVIIYAIVGAAVGYVTLYLFPHQVIRHPMLRIANLCLGPIAAGLLMQQLGSWLERRERGRTKLETFASGFAFALALGLVRYFGTK